MQRGQSQTALHSKLPAGPHADCALKRKRQSQQFKNALMAQAFGVTKFTSHRLRRGPKRMPPECGSYFFCSPEAAGFSGGGPMRTTT